MNNTDYKMPNPRSAIAALGTAAKEWVTTPDDGRLDKEVMETGQAAYSWLSDMGHGLIAEATVMTVGYALDNVDDAAMLMGLLEERLDSDDPLLTERLHLEDCLNMADEKK